MIFLKSKRKRLSKECYTLNFSLIKWLNVHFKVFLEEADKVVDLDFYKFEYKGDIYTLKELVEREIEITERLMQEKDIDALINESFLSDEMMDILKIIFWILEW